MDSQRRIPEDPLRFIRDCVSKGRIYWTYHVVVAADVDGGNVRIISAYAPDPVEWDSSLKRRI